MQYWYVNLREGRGECRNIGYDPEGTCCRCLWSVNVMVHNPSGDLACWETSTAAILLRHLTHRRSPVPPQRRMVLSRSRRGNAVILRVGILPRQQLTRAANTLAVKYMSGNAKSVARDGITVIIVSCIARQMMRTQTCDAQLRRDR